MHRRSSTALIAALAAVALVTTACSPNSDGDRDEPQGQSERVYVEAISADPTGLNSMFAGGPQPYRFSFAVLGTLVSINDRHEISPALAEDWSFSDDGLQMTLDLREGVTWHDGEDFTSADVKFSLEEILPLHTFGAPVAAAIEAVETPDPHTVIVQFSSQYGPLLEALSQQMMLPKHVYEGTDYVNNPANFAPIGTGPMMFESYTPGEQVVLVKNPNWWGGDHEVDRAVYPIMTDVNTRTMAMLSGELDNAVIDPAQQAQVSANSDLEQMTRGFFVQPVTVTFNALNPVLEDAEVRKLLFAAIDREAVLELALAGLGTVATGFFPETLDWARNPDVNFDDEFTLGIDEIKAGLDAAGFPVKEDGWRFSLDARYIAPLTDLAAVGEVMKSSFDEIDVELNLLGTADPIFVEKVHAESDFGIMLVRHTVAADPSLGIARWATCNPERVPHSSASGVCDEKLDAAAAAALATLDRDERAEHFKIMQERMLDSMHYAPLAFTHALYPTVSSARWTDLVAGTGGTNDVPWATMKWVGDE